MMEGNEDVMKEGDEDVMKEGDEDVVKEGDEYEVKEDDEYEVKEDYDYEAKEDYEYEAKEDYEDEEEEDEEEEEEEDYEVVVKEGDEDAEEEGYGDAMMEGDEDAMKEGDEDAVKDDIDEGLLEAIKKQAEVITEDVIKGATNSFQEMQIKEEAAKAKYVVKNIEWMKCEDFTISRGVLQIEEYMKTWELHESWLHWTSYLDEEELKYSMQYHYRVCWSIPTCRKPIPRATASVYFIIQISKIKPPTLPVEVFFMVETNKLIHRPGESRFKEKWLKDVIESKICMMETVDF